MKNKQNGILSELMQTRANIVELFFIAILLALAINLISSSITVFIQPVSALVVGVFLGMVVLGYSMLRLFGNKHRKSSFEGFFIYEKESKVVLPVPRYRYSKEISTYLKSAFSENEALKALWEQEPLEEILKFEDGKVKFNRNRAFDLIVEATEYFIINELSLHLSSYFNDDKYPNERLMNVTRNDIPDVLLSNHFLELFSKSMEERPQFASHNKKKNDKSKPTGKLVYATGKNGAIFDRFELVLPHNSKVKRLSKNCIQIDTDRFKMLVTVEFRGINTFISSEFYKYVMNMNRPKNTKDFQISIDIDVAFKFNTFFSASGWDYYFWVDSFIERFKNSFDTDTFFENIGWEQSLTILNYLNARDEKVVKSTNTELPKEKNA